MQGGDEVGAQDLVVSERPSAVVRGGQRLQPLELDELRLGVGAVEQPVTQVGGEGLEHAA